MNAEQLYEMLQKIQEPKGYFFNSDKAFTLSLLESLLINKKRYGYMACPCRLASGLYEMDKDILCPCIYRIPDVEEYGSCFCGLYVSKEWNDYRIPHKFVPERRPPEKLFAALEAAEQEEGEES
ncbi:MAG: ferredoxin-thioredoxin reductase catalytic domain-containing protein [Desulfovibrionales bacterium]